MLNNKILKYLKFFFKKIIFKINKLETYILNVEICLNESISRI